MVVPIIAAFFSGAGLMGSFNGLNTYAAGKSSATHHLHNDVDVE